NVLKPARRELETALASFGRRQTMAIPKIVHQTAATANPPAWCEPLRQRILHRHPGWDHRFYDDDACRGVLRRAFPYLLPLYDNYPFDIQRVDLFRVVVV